MEKRNKDIDPDEVLFEESMEEEERLRASDVREFEEDYQDYKLEREAKERAQRLAEGRERMAEREAERGQDSRLSSERRRSEEPRRLEDLREGTSRSREPLRRQSGSGRSARREDDRREPLRRQSDTRQPDRRTADKKKKKSPVKRFFSILLAILLIGALLLGVLYYRISGGGSAFLKKVRDAISEKVSTSQGMSGYTNIALFGVDSITESLSSGNNRSDVNIILSVNNKTGEAKLVSVYRDTYLDIGDSTYTKCNAAYAYGGPAQAVSMLNRNFDLNIEDYVTIGFGGISDIIDAVGGIEIDVQPEEVSFLNDYQSTMAAELGKEYVPLTSSGLQTLSGVQATAYCRIRYTDGGDYHRTERQREVLQKTFSKLKAADPATDAQIVISLIGNNEIETSLSPQNILNLAKALPNASISDTTGIPTADLRVEAYVGEQACIIPYTLKQNVVWLHEYLFGESDYQVSDTVETISNQIEANTGY